MNEDENQNNKDSVLNINVSDGIGISDEVTVELSDITITTRGEDNEEHNIVFPQAVSSDVIAQSLSDELCIPADSSDLFQEFIKEKVEYIKKEPWEGKIELSLPLQKFHPHLPSLKILSLEVRAGQKITYKKYTVKSQQPKDEQKK